MPEISKASKFGRPNFETISANHMLKLCTPHFERTESNALNLRTPESATQSLEPQIVAEIRVTNKIRLY